MKAFIGSQISRYHCDSLSAWRNCRGKGGESGFVPTATFNTHKQCWELMFAGWVHDRSFHNCRMWRIVKLQSDHSKHSWEASPISMTEIPVPESQPYCGYFLLWEGSSSWRPEAFSQQGFTKLSCEVPASSLYEPIGWEQVARREALSVNFTYMWL